MTSRSPEEFEQKTESLAEARYRTNELNIGCDPAEIVQRIPQLLGNTKYWLEHKTFPIDEYLIRFHHQLVSKSIHSPTETADTRA
jgi:hypothetical protein